MCVRKTDDVLRFSSLDHHRQQQQRVSSPMRYYCVAKMSRARFCHQSWWHRALSPRPPVSMVRSTDAGWNACAMCRVFPPPRPPPLPLMVWRTGHSGVRPAPCLRRKAARGWAHPRRLRPQEGVHPPPGGFGFPPRAPLGVGLFPARVMLFVCFGGLRFCVAVLHHFSGKDARLEFARRRRCRCSRICFCAGAHWNFVNHFRVDNLRT